MLDGYQPAFSFIKRNPLHPFAVLVSHDGYSHSGLSPVYVDPPSYSAGYFFSVHDLLWTARCKYFTIHPYSAIPFHVLLLLERVGECNDTCVRAGFRRITDGLYMSRRTKNGKGTGSMEQFRRHLLRWRWF